MWWAAVVEGEYVVAWVVVGAEEYSLAILPVAPCAAQRGWSDQLISSYRRDGFFRRPLIIDHLSTRREVGRAHTHLIYGAPVHTTVRPLLP
jgi:hypothetical protein